MVGTKESGLEEDDAVVGKRASMYWLSQDEREGAGAGAAWSRRDLRQAAQDDSPLAARVMHR
jgi:hypothetical protein